jgi:hypothetical protein
MVNKDGVLGQYVTYIRTEMVWNGRDSDELCDWYPVKTREVVFEPLTPVQVKKFKRGEFVKKLLSFKREKKRKEKQKERKRISLLESWVRWTGMYAGNHLTQKRRGELHDFKREALIFGIQEILNYEHVVARSNWEKDWSPSEGDRYLTQEGLEELEDSQLQDALSEMGVKMSDFMERDGSMRYEDEEKKIQITFFEGFGFILRANMVLDIGTFALGRTGLRFVESHPESF